VQIAPATQHCKPSARFSTDDYLSIGSELKLSILPQKYLFHLLEELSEAHHAEAHETVTCTVQEELLSVTSRCQRSAVGNE